MKSHVLRLLIGLGVAMPLIGPAPASDPIGGGPASSISTTVFYISNIKKSEINFPAASLTEVINFLNRWGDESGYGVRIDAAKILSPDTIRVKLTDKNLSLLQAAGLLAEQIQATLLIEPGKIIFVPKPKNIAK